MTPFVELLNRTTYFPGEFEVIEAEFCGPFPTPLVMLPQKPRDRLIEWLSHPSEERQAAYEEVKSWATKPIAAALDRLKNPLKYVAPAGGKPAAQDKTIGTLADWLKESEDEP